MVSRLRLLAPIFLLALLFGVVACTTPGGSRPPQMKPRGALGRTPLRFHNRLRGRLPRAMLPT